jgi:hypothetical protein
VTGVTKNSQGVNLGGCTVDLFRTVDDLKVNSVVSDSSGNFTIVLGTDSYHAYYLTAYLSGSPDVAGITVNNINTIQA